MLMTYKNHPAGKWQAHYWNQDLLSYKSYNLCSYFLAWYSTFETNKNHTTFNSSSNGLHLKTASLYTFCHCIEITVVCVTQGCRYSTYTFLETEVPKGYSFRHLTNQSCYYWVSHFTKGVLLPVSQGKGAKSDPRNLCQNSQRAEYQSCTK